MTVTMRQVAAALRDTIKQADSELEVYSYLNPSPGSVPCAMVNLELDLPDAKSMDRIERQQWRIWVCTQLGDAEEAALQLLDYIDPIGEKSIRAAFRSPTAAWRDVEGISEISWWGFGRMPMAVQSPGWVSFGGPEYWGVALIFRVMYATQ